MNKLYNVFTFHFKKCFSVCMFVILVVLLQGCQSAPFGKTNSSNPRQNNQIATPTPDQVRNNLLLGQAEMGEIFDGNNPAKVSSILILRPTGVGLSTAEQVNLGIIKSSINTNFIRFARGRIEVVNIDDDAALNAEIQRSLAGSNDELSLSARRAAKSVMTGRITKSSPKQYFMEFTVTNTETRVSIASHSAVYLDIELEQGIAVNRITQELLKQLDVRLNDAGILALNNSSNAADTALAKGLVAASSGEGLQAMNYLYNAAAFSTTSSQANSALTSIQNQNQSEITGAGDIVMNFFKRQELWQGRLDEYNTFYNSNAPFELYYTPPSPSNMRRSGNDRLYNLDFSIGLRWSQTQIGVMEKVLKEYVLDGLYKNPTDDIKNWALVGLPEDSKLFNGPDNFEYKLIINVENERGEVITSGPITLFGSLYRYQERIYASCTQELNAAFRDMQYDESKLTPQLYIRVVSINGIDIKTVGETGFMRVAQAPAGKMPVVQKDNLPSGLSNMMQKRITDSNRREQAALRESEKESMKDYLLLHPLKNSRMYAAFNGGIPLGTKTAMFSVDMGMGFGPIDAEVGIGFPVNYAKNPDHLAWAEDPKPFTLRFGLSYALIFPSMIVKVTPGFTWLSLEGNKAASDSSGKETAKLYSFAVGSLQAIVDWAPWGKYQDGIFIRVGYSMEVYPPEIAPLLNMYDENIFLTHTVFIGLVYYMGGASPLF